MFQELQNEMHKFTNIEQPLPAAKYINIDKSVSTFEDLTISEIMDDQNQNSDSSDNESEKDEKKTKGKMDNKFLALI